MSSAIATFHILHFPLWVGMQIFIFILSLFCLYVNFETKLLLSFTPHLTHKGMLLIWMWFCWCLVVLYEWKRNPFLYENADFIRRLETCCYIVWVILRYGRNNNLISSRIYWPEKPFVPSHSGFYVLIISSGCNSSIDKVWSI